MLLILWLVVVHLVRFNLIRLDHGIGLFLVSNWLHATSHAHVDLPLSRVVVSACRTTEWELFVGYALQSVIETPNAF